MVATAQRAPWMVQGIKHGEIEDGWLYIREKVSRRTISIKLVPGLVIESSHDTKGSFARLEVDALGRTN